MSMTAEHRDLVRARESFLADGSVEGTPAIRTEILESWRRSLSCSVDPAVSSPSYVDAPTESWISDIAVPVINRAFESIGSEVASLVLTNADGVVRCRWSQDWPASDISRAFVEVGANLSESSVGANAIGIVQETTRPTIVGGAEHFIESFLSLTCAGTPILHPITNQLVGILDVTCKAGERPIMLLPWVQTVARDVQNGILAKSSRVERVLLDEFVRATRGRGSSRIICLSERVIIATPAATRAIDGMSREMLWEHVSSVVDQSGKQDFQLAMPNGMEIAVTCRAVTDGDQTIGATVRLLGPGDSMARARSSRRSNTRGNPQSEMRSVAWRSVCEQMARAKESNTPILLSGRPGTGKFTLIETQYPDAEIVVYDAIDVTAGADTTSWLGSLQRALENAADNAIVVIRHLEALTSRQRHAVLGIVERHGVHARVLVTESTDNEQPDMEKLAEFNGQTVRIPDLSQRREDFPYLLDSITNSLSRQRRTWRPDAIQMMARAPWPGNLRELRNAVMSILASNPVGDIGIRQLPPEILASAAKRNLTRLERLELNEISNALKFCNGNKVEAAEYLEISRSTLYRKMRSFGLNLDRLAY